MLQAEATSRWKAVRQKNVPGIVKEQRGCQGVEDRANKVERRRK